MMTKLSIEYYLLSIKFKVKTPLLFLITYSSLLIAHYLFLSASGASAQSPSPITTASPAATPKAKENQATKSATDEVRERVRQKVETLAKKPRAVVGTLSEITDSTLQIKNRAGKEEMAATAKDTVFFRVADGKRAEIKFEELVIGDFIVAMGYRNGNNVLEVKRVIAYDKSPISTRQAVYGIVEENQKGVLTIKHPKTQNVWKIKTSSKTKVTRKKDGGFEEIKPTDIEVGSRITAAGTPDAKDPAIITARRVHIIPGGGQGLTTAPKPTKSPSPAGKSSPKPSPTSTP